MNAFPLKLQHICLAFATLFLFLGLLFTSKAEARYVLYPTTTHPTVYQKTFWYPMNKGYRLDWCHSWARHCGSTPANAWCRGRGYDYAAGYKIHHNIGRTRIIGTGQICHPRHCDGYRWIRCARKSYRPGPVYTPPHAKVQRTFYNPRHRGVRVDWCRRYAKECGYPAAHAYCRSRGFRNAASYSVAHNIGYTRIISTGRICRNPECDGFHWVRCRAR